MPYFPKDLINHQCACTVKDVVFVAYLCVLVFLCACIHACAHTFACAGVCACVHMCALCICTSVMEV